MQEAINRLNCKFLEISGWIASITAALLRDTKFENVKRRYEKMGKCSSAVGIGLAGAIVGVCAYSFLSPREQRHIQKGMKNAVDDLKDVAERLTEVM